MTNRSVRVRVPATVGSFGGAAESAALALESSLHVQVTLRAGGRVAIRYFGENGERVPRGRSNLVVRALEAALHLRGREFTGADLEIYSSVPVAVGLGSSTAAVLAGVLAADRLYDLRLDEKTILELAAIFETRSDNLRAAWWGGFVAEGENSSFRRTAVPEDFVLSVVSPQAAPEDSPPAPERAGRAIYLERAAALSDFFARPDEGRAETLAAPLPPLRRKNLRGLEAALEVHAPGTLSVFMCGSGPAVGILAQGDASPAVAAVRDCFARAGVETTWGEFRPCNQGARELNGVGHDLAFPPVEELPPAEEKPALATA